jgi:hypothetical protein
MHYWTANPPADETKIDKLVRVVQFPLPGEYLDLLRRANGGEGALALAPLWLQLWSVDAVIEFSRSKLDAWRFPGYFFFADNGAGESIAMRRTPEGSLEIVMIDRLAGLDSAQVIARDFSTFVAAIGK